ncbi:MAG: YihY/virulence factor BrkB family protein [Polyangiales bacterium]
MPPSTKPRSLLRETFHLFSSRGARFLGAAVAFYALLSAAPLFVVVLHVVALVFGRARAERGLWDGLSAWVAPEGLSVARELTLRLDTISSSGSALGLLLVVYASTRLFRALRRALNQLWGIDLESIESERRRSHRYAVRYGQAFALTLFSSLLVAALIVAKGAFAFLAEHGTRTTPTLLWVVDLTTSVLLTFALFVALFRVLPEADVGWREASLSALVSTVLFALGSSLVTAYVRHKHVADLYEGASAVVLAVVWVYYSAQVFFLGACVGAALRARDRTGA